MDCINSIAHVSSFQSRVRSLYDLCSSHTVKGANLGGIVSSMRVAQFCSMMTISGRAEVTRIE